VSLQAMKCDRYRMRLQIFCAATRHGLGWGRECVHSGWARAVPSSRRALPPTAIRLDYPMEVTLASF
jgi:hypothetical protein